MKRSLHFFDFGITLLVLALIAHSTFAPRSRMWGPVFSHASRHCDCVAVTFDDGPNEPYTSEILRILKADHAHATFFLIGENALTYPGTVREIVRDGNEIGNHSFTHPRLIEEGGSQMAWQVDHTQDVLEQISGIAPRWFRPPYGTRDPRLFPKTRREDLRVAEWSKMSRDWTKPGVDRIVSRTLKHLKPGDIILLHDGDNTIHGGDRSETVAALPFILAGIRARGLTPVTVSELAARSGGKTYSNRADWQDSEPTPTE